MNEEKRSEFLKSPMKEGKECLRSKKGKRLQRINQ